MEKIGTVESELSKIFSSELKPFFKEIVTTLKRRFANNVIATYELDNTAERTPVRFQKDTSNNPINKIEVLTTGGGLRLWVNGNKGFECSVGTIIEDIEIMVLEYQITGAGTASILTYARVD